MLYLLLNVNLFWLSLYLASHPSVCAGNWRRIRPRSSTGLLCIEFLVQLEDFWFNWTPRHSATLAMQIDWFLMRMKGFMLCFFTFMFSTTALQFKLVVHSDHAAFAVHRYFCLRCRTVADQARRQLISITVNDVDSDVETELISAVQSLLLYTL